MKRRIAGKSNSKKKQKVVTLRFDPIEEGVRSHAFLFNRESGSDVVKLKVWGASHNLYLHERILNSVKLPVCEMIAYTEDKNITFSKECVESLCPNDNIRDFWKSVWIFFAMIYGTNEIIINYSHIFDHEISMQQCANLLSICDFIGDTTVANLIGRMLNSQFDSLSIEDFNLLCPQVLKMYFEKIPALVNFMLKIIQKHELHTTETDAILLRSLLEKNFNIISDVDADTLKTLDKFERRSFESGKIGRYSDEENRRLANIFIPITEKIWAKVNYFGQSIIAELNAPREEIRIQPQSIYNQCRNITNYVLCVDRINHYWNYVFCGLPVDYKQHLVMSGSIIPMCFVDFEIPNFGVTVSTLFPDSDMDIYVIGENPESVVEGVTVFLHKKHQHVWQKSDYTRECKDYAMEIHVITLVISGHPLFKHNSLHVRLIYYKSTDSNPFCVTPQQIALWHHVCPVRAYYDPCRGLVYAAPSALICWHTGYIRYYRSRQCKERVNVIFKYIKRRFGVVIYKDDKEDNSVKRLEKATRALLDILPDLLPERIQSTYYVKQDNSMLLAISDESVKLSENRSSTCAKSIIWLLSEKRLY